MGVVEYKMEFVVVLGGFEFEEKMASLFMEFYMILMKNMNFLGMIYFTILKNMKL